MNCCSKILAFLRRESRKADKLYYSKITAEERQDCTSVLQCCPSDGALVMRKNKINDLTIPVMM